MSFAWFALAVILIIRLFSTSAFRVPKLDHCFTTFLGCDPLLLTTFLKPTVRNCGNASSKKLRYEKEINYEQYTLCAVNGKLELDY